MEGDIRYAIPQAKEIRPNIRTILEIPMKAIAVGIYVHMYEPGNIIIESTLISKIW